MFVVGRDDGGNYLVKVEYEIQLANVSEKDI